MILTRRKYARPISSKITSSRLANNLRAGLHYGASKPCDLRTELPRRRRILIYMHAHDSGIWSYAIRMANKLFALAALFLPTAFTVAQTLLPTRAHAPPTLG